MGAPFRGLFVELPAAVFEALQGIGEAAISARQTAQTAAPPPRQRETLFSERWIRRVHSRYGWHWAQLQRREDDRTMRILAELDCGHLQSYSVDERSVALVRGPADEIALLDRIVDTTERRCLCVQRPEAA